MRYSLCHVLANAVMAELEKEVFQPLVELKAKIQYDICRWHPIVS